ncbi:MAG: hypothetical protein ACKVQS_04750 [Fimbriimonadaceae bacterium]
MKKALIGTTIAVMALGSAMVFAQNQTPQARKGTAENRLVGISLYDTGAKVVSTYGSPDEIQALVPGGTAAGGGGGAQGGGAGGRGGGDGGGLGAPPSADIGGDNGTFALVGDPFGSGAEWRQQRGPSSVGAPVGAGGGPEGDGDGGGRGGAPGAGGRGGGGGAAGGGGNSGKVIFTRWVYKRSGSHYSFVLDKFNRVIQIEAIGMKNSNVKTRRGITFGSSFSSLIKAYNAPDSYEVNGENLVVRFLVRDRVAFRLNRLYKDKPQVVTGVVVAAGKT